MALTYLLQFYEWEANYLNHPQGAIENSSEQQQKQEQQKDTNMQIDMAQVPISREADMDEIMQGLQNLTL